jgi:5-formyltetrahydrofolate cyclo-ligase
VIATKRELRARALALRAKKADPRAAEKVAEQALRELSFAKTDIVSAYVAMESELDPGPLLRALDRRGIRLALPVVEKKGAPLSFRRYRPGNALEAGVFGTRHPLPDQETVRPTIVLVPLLAFDAEGYRLGYGGGYYDRTLAALRREGALLAVGLAYAFQEMPALPHMPYDAPLDVVVTENGVRRFRQGVAR